MTKRWVLVLTYMVLVAATRLMAAEASEADAKAVKNPTFHKDVIAIFQENCQVCHRPGQVAPFSLMDYKSARPWAKAIKTAVQERRMPPWFANPQYGHFNNDRSLSQAEIDTLLAWVDQGAPEGDSKDAPPAVKWPEGGWTVQPDAVADVPAFAVEAKGVIEWQSILLPTPFKEDTWITSVQILPSDYQAVHHMCFEFQKRKPELPLYTYEWAEVARKPNGETIAPDGKPHPDEGTIVRRKVGSQEVMKFQGKLTIKGSNEFCYLPGLTLEDYRPVNAGLFVPKDSVIALDLHYTTYGKPGVDKTRIGFTTSKTPPAKRFINLNSPENPVDKRIQDNTLLKIPPYDANYAGPPADITFKKDTELVWFRPHTHFRGKSARYTLTYPDGREEIVLDVPKYDFNWQLTYRTSLKIPAGSRMHAQFYYDNSANNKNNPDPSQWVYYGGMVWEEMGTPNMGFLVDADTKAEDLVQ